MSVCSIDDKNEKQLMVIWDLGRRCTFACSYCPPHRKNNWSDTASLDELKKAADNLHRYSEIYNKHRDKPFRVATSFTGGEPTVNPSFFPFLEYLQETYPDWKRTLTTNGFYSERKLRRVMKNTAFTTVSYHCEATPQQKQRVRENMKIMMDEGYGFTVNVMFHEKPEYFKECVDLCIWLDSMGARYTPRVIGDQSEVKLGIKDKTVHEYSNEQMKWLKNYWNHNSLKVPVSTEAVEKNIIATDSSDKKTVGQSMGRPCCGGRNLTVTDEDGHDSETKFITDNNFKGWSCMVNWYFLYIHQEIDKVWHHQTCQVDIDGNVGPISSLSEFDKYCDKLETTISTTGSIPFIRCPKTYCGCGLCVPKAKSDEDAVKLFESHTSSISPSLMNEKEATYSGSLKQMVYSYDKDNGNQTI